MFGGSGSMIVALAFSSSKTADTLRKLVNLDESSSKIVLYGASISIGMYVSYILVNKHCMCLFSPIPCDSQYHMHYAHKHVSLTVDLNLVMASV